jgi:hypothetical protein
VAEKARASVANEAWQVLPKAARWSHVISYSPLHKQIDDLLRRAHFQKRFRRFRSFQGPLQEP